MGIKITKIEANKTRKNLLGRTVSVNRTRQGAAPVSKTRTVTSKNGGVISSKTSYKDSESVAGKMRSNKIDKINRKQFVKNAKEGAKEGAAKTSLATKRGIKNATKMNEARDAYMNNPGKYDPAKVEKAMETGRGRKVQRVMRREFKNNQKVENMKIREGKPSGVNVKTAGQGKVLQNDLKSAQERVNKKAADYTRAKQQAKSEDRKKGVGSTNKAVGIKRP